MAAWGILSPLERAHFLAQVAHESAGFTRLVENLNYSALGLRKTWPMRFNAPDSNAYARQPERIANKVYAGRLGNGDEASGDGWRYRGRGFIQTTGRGSYAMASAGVFGDARLVDDPGLLEGPHVAAPVACHYWVSRHLDIPAARDDLIAVTRGVNGGLTGLDDRGEWLAKFKQALQVTP
jgi:putative chitinase